MGLNTRKRDRVVAIGAAKNCITIGASESTRQTASTYHDAWPLNYPQPPIRNDSISGNLDDQGEREPSAALVKALLINGTAELIGQYNPPKSGPSPNPNSGWDRADLAHSVIFMNQQNAGYAQVNQEERHGNTGLSQGFDRVNNFEQVYWLNVHSGEAKVRVQADRITKYAQKYACVWRVITLLESPSMPREALLKMWAERAQLKNTAKEYVNRFSFYTDKVKDSIAQFKYDNRHNKAAINWDEKLAKEIENLKNSLDHQCLQDFRLEWQRQTYGLDMDEKTERLVQPRVDEMDAKFVEYMNKTVDGLKKKRKEGFSGEWDLTDWQYEYQRYMDDLVEYVADMNDDINDDHSGSESE
ncbi:hypothetical protein ASPWEDRAFT_26446 [Aspergillus wentii DTO 134E9]|uniref:Uncharacterized protein n=1 Tax=Aspergillus wentii DTO 134E9 TaxID=1073089 RepID=A0A1L9RQ09_ASPWE|nr:uncharacterized protein ASPWEDRAFT_26446 [Aspergillus wentii DTO 134E9]OJJ37019.1 hypothetical protein ASPWEDRAFT_26446 [Aspergillus wentii DTO 134E9]